VSATGQGSESFFSSRQITNYELAHREPILQGETKELLLHRCLSALGAALVGDWMEAWSYSGLATLSFRQCLQHKIEFENMGAHIPKQSSLRALPCGLSEFGSHECLLIKIWLGYGRRHYPV
jgi:hypothetical protein